MDIARKKRVKVGNGSAKSDSDGEESSGKDDDNHQPSMPSRALNGMPRSEPTSIVAMQGLVRG